MNPPPVQAAAPPGAPRVAARRVGPIWLPRPRADATLRLYCFGHAGGWSGSYAPFAEPPDPRIEVALVEQPGRGFCAQAAPAASVDELVCRLGMALAPGLRDRPAVAFLGHSMGALVAFELQHWLLRHGCRTADVLLLSSCHAPDVLADRIGFRPADPPEDELLLQRLRAMGGTPAEVLEHEELRTMLLSHYRHDLGLIAAHRHSPRAALATALHVLGGEHDPFVPIEALAGWQRHADRPVAVHAFPGRHFHLHEDAAATLLRLQSLLLPFVVNAQPPPGRCRAGDDPPLTTGTP